MLFPLPNPEKRPTTENVDYFQYDFDLLDMHTCWKNSLKAGKNKNYYIAIQGKRRENATWRRFFQNFHNIPKLNPKELDWSKDRDRHWFYGPFYSNDNFCPGNTLHCISAPIPNLKPAIKRKLHPKDYIQNIQLSNPLRRMYSDSALADISLESQNVKNMLHSPSTPKDIIIQFFEEESLIISPPVNAGKRIIFNPCIQQRVFDSNSDTPISVVEFYDGGVSSTTPDIEEEMFSNLTIAPEILPILPNDKCKHTKIQNGELASRDRSDGLIPEECKTNFRLPNEIVSKYLSNWEKDFNYHTDTDYLDYPPEEIEDANNTFAPMVITFYHHNESYTFADYASDAIVNTTRISSFLWTSVTAMSLW